MAINDDVMDKKFCVAGFAIPTSKRERTVIKVVTFYSTIALAFSNYTTGMDSYHCFGIFQEFVYAFIGFGTCFIAQSKFATFTFKRRKYLHLMKYTREILWTKYHNNYGKYVIKACEKQAMFFIIFFISLALSVNLCYTIQALLLNIGRNESDRLFPFPLWVDLPIYITPWYEITFVTQVLSGYHTAVCYFCFDNFLALTNIFVTGQFKILKNRLETLFDPHNSIIEFRNETHHIERLDSVEESIIKKALHELKCCIKQHQILIDLVDDVEDLYSMINLVQVLVFSFLICLVGYQLILVCKFVRKM